jgi:hypothetical protein
MMRYILISLAALLATGTDARAQHVPSYMAIINGTCSQLTIADVDHSTECPKVVFNTAYVDNYSSFRIVAEDGTVVSFFGYDNEAVGDVAKLAVERIIFTPANAGGIGGSLVEMTRRAQQNTKEIVATGQCEYTNPDLPDNHIKCEAVADGKSYSFTFRATDFEVVNLGGRIQ